MKKYFTLALVASLVLASVSNAFVHVNQVTVVRSRVVTPFVPTISVHAPFFSTAIHAPFVSASFATNYSQTFAAPVSYGFSPAYAPNCAPAASYAPNCIPQQGPLTAPVMPVPAPVLPQAAPCDVPQAVLVPSFAPVASYAPAYAPVQYATSFATFAPAFSFHAVHAVHANAAHAIVHGVHNTPVRNVLNRVFNGGRQVQVNVVRQRVIR